MTEPSTPAGWYPDPDGSGGQRYWNGTAWTEDRSPVPWSGGAKHATPVPEAGRATTWAWVAGGVAALVAVGVGLVLLFASIGPGIRQTTSTHTTPSLDCCKPEPTIPPEPVATPASAGIGQEVRDGTLAYVVTGVENGGAFVASDEFPDSLSEQAQGEFLIVNMTVTNVGDAPHTYFSSSHELIVADTAYPNHEGAWVLFGNLITDLNPGDSLDTAAVFDVPVGTVPDAIKLRDSLDSDGATVTLKS